ncbi:MAG: FHA domain-containing protein [Bacteroidales bacterium]|nr:FHA domain-containing protein [Bacteroidales bacterium]
MNDILTIGRASDNHLVIKLPIVSSKHCSIKKMPDDRFIIEDLDSSNGTFLNGKRIKQAILQPGDELALATFPIDVKMILDLLESGPLKTGINYEEFRKQELIYMEFSKLKGVYGEYQKKKRYIMKTNNLKSTGIRAGLSVIPVVGSALGILSGTITGNVQADLMELEEDFKRNYICPGCFKFLGAEPFENMEKRGFCLICKTKWIKKSD